MSFIDRTDAGKKLCSLLEKYKLQETVVYALPRGGVVVAAEIARYLKAPLDLILVQKIGHPYHEEYAVAALSEKGYLVETECELNVLGHDWLEKQKRLKMAEIKRKRSLYLPGRQQLSPENKVAIIVDDGIATGLTMQVAIRELRDSHPKLIVVAVPVAPSSIAELLSKMVDEFVAVKVPGEHLFLGAVGAYYHQFFQVEDQEVVDLITHIPRVEVKKSELFNSFIIRYLA